MFSYYLRTAFRILRKNKMISFINIAGLSIGMTAAVFIFLWVQNEMSFDAYRPDADHIYRITDTLTVGDNNNWIWEASPLPLVEAAKENIPGIKKVASYMPADYALPVFNVHGQLFPEKNTAFIDKEWFDLFHYDFIAGDPSSFFSDPFSVILTASEAKKYFGNSGSIGKVIRIDSLNFTVKGVVKDNPSNSSFQFNALFPLEVYLSDPRNRKSDMKWNNFNHTVFVELRKEADINKVSQTLTGIAQKNKKDNKINIGLEPLKAMHFESGLQNQPIRGDKRTVYIFSILGFLLLLTACINYVNLTTAKASLRAKEISIRKITGARRRQLFRQLITESFLTSLAALCITLILVQLCLPLFNRITGKNFHFAYASWSLWKVLLGTLLAATILNGIYPAVLLSSFKPLSVFRGVNLLRVKDAPFRKTLVVLQFVVSVALIIGTTIIYEQIRFIRNTNPGYNRSHVFSVSLPFRDLMKYSPDQRATVLKTIKQELLTQSGIEAVTYSNQPIVNVISTSAGSADWKGRDTNFNPSVTNLVADAGFQQVFHLQMKEGRWFLPGDKADLRNFILNEAAVREFNMRKPIVGQWFVFHGDTGRVIGVTKDFIYQGPHKKTGPVVIFYSPNWHSCLLARTAGGRNVGAIQAAGAVWKKFFPDTPFDYSFLDDTFNALYKSDQQAAVLIFIFSVIAVVISILGLFGLAAFAAERRTKEIGIRKVLGASIQSIVNLLAKDFVLLILIAIIVASPIALFVMHKWLQNFAYRIHISWWIFAGTGMLAIMVVLITVGLQAIKAAIANPVEALRSE